MEVAKIYSNKSFGIITLFVLLISVCINVGHFYDEALIEARWLNLTGFCIRPGFGGSAG